MKFVLICNDHPGTTEQKDYFLLAESDEPLTLEYLEECKRRSSFETYIAAGKVINKQTCIIAIEPLETWFEHYIEYALTFA